MSEPRTIYTRDGGAEVVTGNMVNGAIDRALSLLLRLGHDERLVRLAELELIELRAGKGDHHD